MADQPARVLVVNAGSSSLKLRVLDPDDAVTGSADLPAPDGKVSLDGAIEGLGPVDAVGHRIVHGGMRFSGPVMVTDDVRRGLEALTDLAPLHQPKSLAALDAVQAALPGVPAVACFDTAFHASIPAAAATFALPQELRSRWMLRRYGFHGLSHSYASRRAAQLLLTPGGATTLSTPRQRGGAAPLSPPGPETSRTRSPQGDRTSAETGNPPSAARIVTCHLGAGASLAAVHAGRSVDTTMGFTPLDGLVMATRSGAVDPGLVLWLEEHAGIAAAALAAMLENRSGLLGLAGTADMREVLIRAASGDDRALLAREVYLHRLRASIAAMAAAMNGLDALVFTGGVGERSAEIRSRAASGLAFLGVGVDDARNAHGAGDDYEITAEGAPVRAFVIAAREDKEISAQVRATLEPFRPSQM